MPFARSVAIKNAAWVLPPSDVAMEDYQWLIREIEVGGEALLCEARFRSLAGAPRISYSDHGLRGATRMIRTAENDHGLASSRKRSRPRETTSPARGKPVAT